MFSAVYLFVYIGFCVVFVEGRRRPVLGLGNLLCWKVAASSNDERLFFPVWGKLPGMNKSFVFLLLALLSLTCFAQNAATVIFTSGKAQIVGKDGQARPALRGSGLDAGETVETMDGRVQLRFLDGASMSLQAATRFRIDEFRFVDQGGKASAGDSAFFSLLKGGFRTLSGLIGKEHREQYKVDAVVATIGIRGTGYAAHLDEAGLDVSTFAGLVEVCSNAGCAFVAAGESVYVTDRDSPPRRDRGKNDGIGFVPTVPDVPPPQTVELPPVNATLPTTVMSPATAGGEYSPYTGSPTHR